MERLGPGDPHRIGAYRLLARLGAGGMGHVYLARSDRGRTVAVKLVRGELAAQEEFRARFRQEVRAARRVGGHWTAPVLDADTEAAVPWVATGYVAGPSLQQVVGHDHGPLPERSVRVLAAGLAHALKDIHAAGIVHRDLKPSNVLVTIDGPRVIDFGIARALQTVTDAGLTRTGALVGSPGFMAPEQVRGDRITPACDVFCLGSVLAYAATGELPFGSSDSGVHALMFRIAREEPDLRGVPEGIAGLVRACLEKDPAARPGLDEVLERTGAGDTVADGRSRDPWLPSALVAQLGRHAVRLLDTEHPEGPDAGTAPRNGTAVGTAPPGGAAPEHASAAEGGGPHPRPGPDPSGTPFDHLPTLIAGQGAPAPPPAHPAAHGHPQPHPPSAAPGAWSAVDGTPGPYRQPYAAPVPYGGAYGATPPYGPPPPGSAPPHGPPREPRPGGTTVLLVVIALVVALAAGGTVYALMNGGGDPADDGRTTAPPTGAPTTPGTDTPGADTPGAPSPTGSAARPDTTEADGTVPAGYLGTWTTTIDNASGRHSRRLTIRQGEVGDTVLSLVADGPAGNGTYHCVFEAELASEPAPGGPLRIGPSTVAVGQPRSSCAPGEPSRVALLPDGTLQRVNTGTGESLTYRRE
ncbi:Serine_threonine-protein kinase PknD [Streptomyces sp. enrichment culture]|uniref:serine/threonine-protein kinase n=1 Tax=Streptomyces sp. enrichment culture TaxID=1795815 RepID=UPI003F55F5BC